MAKSREPKDKTNVKKMLVQLAEFAADAMGSFTLTYHKTTHDGSGIAEFLWVAVYESTSFSISVKHKDVTEALEQVYEWTFDFYNK